MENVLNVAEESMNAGEQIVKLLENFNLFWSVSKQPLLTPDGHKTPFYGTMRDDNKKVFACVKDGYKVLQNWELAEMVQEVAGRFNMDIARGGEFNGGARVYLQIHTGDLKGIGDNNDTVKKYISALNSHDGSASVGFGMTNVTVSCSNTFHAAYRDLGRIKHTMSMKDRIDAMTREFTKVRVAEETLYEKFMKMASQEATTEDIKQIVHMSTAVNLDTKEDDAKTLYSSYQINMAKKITTRISEEMAVKGQTLWGLFSGVTKYTNRDIRIASRDNATLESKFMGSAGKTDNKVFNYLSDLVIA